MATFLLFANSVRMIPAIRCPGQQRLKCQGYDILMKQSEVNVNRRRHRPWAGFRARAASHRFC